MFGILNIGPWELFLIIVVALVIFGPGKLPEVGRTLGKAFQEFRKASAGIQKVLNETIDLSKNLTPDNFTSHEAESKQPEEN
jgi:sec-independent protein translocase protein TatA